jgi:polyisoprenoid-binding protein YceI
MNPVSDRRTGSSPGVERWEIDPARSSLTFNLRHIVVQEIRGRFERWGGTLFIDRRQPWLSSVHVWVDLASITTDDPERDAHVRSSEFLDVARFPRAEFQSTNVEVPDGHVVVEGLLSIRGIVHDVELRAEVEVGETASGPAGRERTFYTARGVVDRQSFGLHWNQDLDIGGIVVGDEVEIAAKVEVLPGPAEFARVDAEPALIGGSS